MNRKQMRKVLKVHKHWSDPERKKKLTSGFGKSTKFLGNYKTLKVVPKSKRKAGVSDKNGIAI